MSDMTLLAEPMTVEVPAGPVSREQTTRSQFLILQSVFAIVLCYQFLFSLNNLTAPSQAALVLGMLLTIPALMAAPPRFWSIEWFTASLVLADTVFTTVVIYLSGGAGSEMYLTYFLIILLAAFTQSLKQHLVLSVTLCAGYWLTLYLGADGSDPDLQGKLLRIPVLLIMATFYGAAAEMVRKERQQKVGLLDSLTASQRANEERSRLIRELQDALANVKSLQGLLPICSLCKKVRDDRGYWSQIETYLRKHSNADFSHGICPECVGKLYPDTHQVGYRKD
jgi:hypothetical protein